eukprot:gene6001-8263_t
MLLYLILILSFLQINCNDEVHVHGLKISQINQVVSDGIIEEDAQKFEPVSKNSVFRQMEIDKTLNHRSDISKRGRSSKSQLHEVVFAVKQVNIDELTTLVNEVSNPISSKYGNHLTSEEVYQLTANIKSINQIKKFFKRNNIVLVEQSLYGDYLTATAPIGKWETVLNAEFYSFEISSSHGIQTFHRALHYSLPLELIDHVETVLKTTQFPAPNVFNSAIHLASANTDPITPSVLNSYYNISGNTRASTATQAVYAPSGQYFGPSDLNTFQSTFGLPVKVVNNSNGRDNDIACQTNANSCTEGNLDIQYMMGIAQNVQTIFSYWDGSDIWVSWLVSIASMSKPPAVISISYGNYESDISTSIFRLFNIQALKLAVQGVTLVAASGDDGAAGHDARTDSSKCGYNPIFPASSPYVTTLGGTKVSSASVEVTCQSDNGGEITTGGGVSDYYGTPSWQSDSFKSYFAANLQSFPSGYSLVGRGYPDLSLLAYNYQVVVGGSFFLVSGTSATAPVFAGMVSLINAARLKAGLSTVGYLNPTLYKYQSSFVNDVTSGDNFCTINVCCSEGFVAASGWDPVTGLGSVNFGKLQSLLISLGSNLNKPSSAPTTILSGSPTISPSQVLIPNTPTASPSSNPSSTTKPTTNPTTSIPTIFSTKWVYSTTYSQIGCVGSVAAIHAFPAQTCLPVQYKEFSSISSYVRYSCGSNGVIVQYYSDSSCKTILNEVQNAFECDSVQETYGSFSSDFLSSQFACSSSSSYSDLIPTTGFNYTVNETYAEKTSCTTLTQVSVYLQRYCFNLKDSFYADAALSYYYSGNKLTTFSAVGCKSSSAANQFTFQNNVCGVIDSSSLATLMYIARTSTHAPSTLPTFAPTALPTTETYVVDKITNGGTCNGDLFIDNSLTYIIDTCNHVVNTVDQNGVKTLYAGIPFNQVVYEPTLTPISNPTTSPTPSPSSNPTTNPTPNASSSPTSVPTASPTVKPTANPSQTPSSVPSSSPSSIPTAVPSSVPTSKPTSSPTAVPSIANDIITTYFTSGCSANHIFIQNGAAYITDPCKHVVWKKDLTTLQESVVFGQINTPSVDSTALNGDGGLAIFATLNRPFAVVADTLSNFYIADTKNNKIRKVMNTQFIYTYAGTGIDLGTADNRNNIGDGGVATSASFKQPTGVWIDSTGALYVADSGNYRIRKISYGVTFGGTITTYVGSGTTAAQSGSFSGDNGLATAATLKLPTSVWGDSNGNLYIADMYNNRIRRVNQQRIITTVIGSGASSGSYNGDSIPATSANLNRPSGVWIDSNGNIYLTESSNHIVRKVARNGLIYTIAGTAGVSGYSGDSGTPVLGELSYPFNIAADTNGLFYVADKGNNVVRTFTANPVKFGSSVRSSTWTTIDATATDLVYQSVFTKRHLTTATNINLYNPTALAMDSNRNLLIADKFADQIWMVNANDNSVSYYSGIIRPEAMWCDTSNNLYIIQKSKVIRLTLSNGNIANVAGDGLTSSESTFATSTSIYLAQGIWGDTQGNLFIADTTSNRIRKIVTSSGIISTYAGVMGSSGYNGNDIAATAAYLSSPSGVWCNTIGDVYIADTGNNLIRKVELSSGIITTIAGTNPLRRILTSVATSTALFSPKTVFGDRNGNIYFIDQNGEVNKRYRQVKSSEPTSSPSLAPSIKFTSVFVIQGTNVSYYYSNLQTLTTTAVKTVLDQYQGSLSPTLQPTFFAVGFNRKRMLQSSSQVTSTKITVETTAALIEYNFNNATKLFLYLTDKINQAVANNVLTLTLKNQAITSQLTIAQDTSVVSVSHDLFSDDAFLTTSDTVVNIVTDFPTSAPTAIRAVVSFAVTYNLCGILNDTNIDDVTKIVQECVAFVGTTTSLGIVVGAPTKSPATGTKRRRLGDSQLDSFNLETTASAPATKCVNLDVRNDFSTAGLEYLDPSRTSFDNTYKFLLNNINESIQTGRFIDVYNQLQAYNNITTTENLDAGAPETDGTYYVYYPGQPTPSPSSRPTRSPTYKPAVISTFSTSECSANFMHFGADGESYQVDACGHVVRSYDSQGNLVIVAGMLNKPSYDSTANNGDGSLATSATLNRPWSVAVSSTGIMYISDQQNNKVRKMDQSSGIIVTYVGNGNGGFGSGDGIPATSACLSSPSDIFLDTNGQLFIADSKNYRIRMVNVNGIISTIAGSFIRQDDTALGSYSGDNGPATAATLKLPTGVWGDSNGNIYIADMFNNRIRKVSQGIITTVIGSGASSGLYNGDSLVATSANLNRPSGVWVDSNGNIYLTDSGNHIVRFMSAYTGRLYTVAGTPGSKGYSGDGGDPKSALLTYPINFVGDNNGNFYVSDKGNSVIRKFNWNLIGDTFYPTSAPTNPTARPTPLPSTRKPSNYPSAKPSIPPTSKPTAAKPTAKPS